MRQRTWYEFLSGATLSVSAAAAILAVAGAALQRALSVAASGLCAVAFAIPGLYLLGHARRLRTRDVALAHVAAFATDKGTFDVRELASAMKVSREDAEKFLRTAMREGHLRGHFDARGWFVTDGRPEPGGPT